PIDHITWLPGATPAGYVADATYDGLSNPERLGYPRFGNKLTKADVLGTATCTPGASTVYTGPAYGTHFLDNGVLRLDFNRVWGNALGRITQVSSCHQIVSEPIGDLVQTVVRFPDAVQPDGTAIDDPDCRNPNPTQSGGVWGNTSTEPTNYGKTEYWTGSPVLSTTKTTVGESQVLTSVVRPFEFVNNGVNQGDGSVPWSGAEPRSPLAWKGFIERTDVLGCKIGSVSPITRRDVVKTTSRLILAPNNGFSSYNVYSLNTYWLKATDLVVNTVPVVWDFKIECKNLRTGVIRPLLADAAGNVILNQGDASCGDDDNDPATAPDDHAILVTKKDGSFGYAVERLNLVVNEGTNVTFRCVANPCDTNDKGALIIQPARNQFSSRSSVNKTSWSIPLDTFLVVNNRNSMLIRLDELRTDGGDCLN
nr:hypothetical protein [Thermoanaerobaculia bacterium]